MNFQKKADALGVPLVHPLESDLPPRKSVETLAVCGQCGLALNATMFFRCYDKRCPTGLGGPTCLAGL